MKKSLKAGPRLGGIPQGYKETLTDLMLSIEQGQQKENNMITKKFEQPEDVTLLIKSFLRKECVDALINSIRVRYPTIPIVVVDDSAQKDEKPWNFDYDENIKTYNLPFDSGLSAGRNHGVKNIKTKYFVLLDDDFVFTDKTDLALMKRLIEEGNYDILGGVLREKGNYLRGYSFNFIWDEISRELTVKKLPTITNGKTIDTECVINFFIAKTESIKMFPWDDELKVCEHSAFFFDCRKKLKVGYNDSLEIFHLQKSSPFYSSHRNRGKEFTKKMLVKRNIKKYKALDGSTYLNEAYQN